MGLTILFAAWTSSVIVERAPDGHGAAVQLEGVVDAPLRDVEATLLAADQYPRWFPSLLEVRASDPNAPIETTIWMPWPLRNAHETIRLERRRIRHGVVVSWRHVRGDFVRDDGSWTLIARGPSRTAVRYAAIIQLRQWTPTWLIRRIERRGAPRLMRALEQQSLRPIQRRARRI
jgi:hypothetical protein